MRRVLTGVVAVFVGLSLLAGCAEEDEQPDEGVQDEQPDEEVQDDQPDEDAGDDGAEDAGTLEEGALDVETLEATTDDGTYEALELESSFVGAVDDDLFVGVSVVDDEATVYLCDGDEVAVWLSGEVVEDDATRLGGFEDGASVELAVDEELVTGSVRLAGDPRLRAFEATPATGDAGLFRAEETFDGEDRVAGWVVLEDGRQQGSPCIPIPCCGPRGCFICGCVPQRF